MKNQEAKSFSRNDVTFDVKDNIITLTHKSGAFAPITRGLGDINNPVAVVYTTSQHKLEVVIDTFYADYFVLSPEGVAMDKKYTNYNDAVAAANKLDTVYFTWLAEHTFKGLSKTKLVEDIKAGKIQVKRIFSSMKGAVNDNTFYPVVKRNGHGSVDIVRDNKLSCLFYLNDMKANRLLYTGDKLIIFDMGIRKWNKKETACVAEWESRRDRKAEWADLISDGSQEFYRKKYFFENHGCEHLMRQSLNGLVRDNHLRGIKCLVYEVQKIA